MNKADARGAAVQVIDRERLDARLVADVLYADGINDQKAALYEIVVDSVADAIQRYVALREHTSTQ